MGARFTGGRLIVAVVRSAASGELGSPERHRDRSWTCALCQVWCVGVRARGAIVGASVLLVIVVVIAGSAFAVPHVHATADARTKEHRPNVLFVLAVDLDLAEMQYMRMTRNVIGGLGATFDKYF